LKFEDFVRNKKVRKTSFDKGLFASLVKTSKLDLEYLDSVEINGFSSRKTMSNYYDVMRAYLEALGLKKGYKIYSHEAFTFFLKEIDEVVLAIKFDRMRKIRNGINYYGEDITVEEVKANVIVIKEIIKRILELL
jgi:hypothetical protein